MAYNYTNPFSNWQFPSYIPNAPVQPQSNGIIWVQGEAGAKADLKNFTDEIKSMINERNNYHKRLQNKE